MKKRRKISRRSSLGRPIPWLPIDSRILPNIFSFGHVRGVARIFLEVEIVISLLVVTGTLIIVALNIIGLQ